MPRRDDDLDALKRRVIHLARLDGDVLQLSDGLFVARAKEVASPRDVVARLRDGGTLDQRTVERSLRLEMPLTSVDIAEIAAAQRDLKILATKPMLTLARGSRRVLARFGTVDEEWIEKKRARIEQLRAALHAQSRRPKDRWFEGVVELVRVLRGDAEANAVHEASVRIRARGDERRRTARDRVASLASALASSSSPDDPELAKLAARLDAARDLPGRARRRRVLDVLRLATAWPSAPASLVEPLGAQEAARLEIYADRVAKAGAAMASGLPAVRDPSVAEQLLELVSILALAFPVGDDGVPMLEEAEVSSLIGRIDEVLELAPSGITIAKAVRLANIPMRRPTRRTISRWVAEGLAIDLVAEAAEKKHIEPLATVPDVRAARAYATWVTRLAAHYQAQGIAFTLSPELFASLPKNEDLAVLAMCLMEQVDGKTPNARDPIEVLDATLALFQKLPTKAKGILGNLRREKAGEGRRLFPELAAWLDDDALLGRCIHVARLAGETVLLSAAVREDFEHTARAKGERDHLKSLATRSPPQQARLDLLEREERTLAGSPKGRTRRRLAERIEQLLPKAYRRELDTTFREILFEAWGIAIPSLTPEWRDAVRFWLVVDDNKLLLERLLREAATAPGRDVKRSSAKNLRWIEAARHHLHVDRWLAPRAKTIVGDKQRYRIELEEDPLEVLRMGIPFATCLALDGCNAASTVINATDANKRVLYVRNEAGRVVARKLLAISKDWRLVGYNLYVSVSGDEEALIRSAVFEMCRAIATDTGMALSPMGVPAKIHEGFWYDDGTVAFDDDVDLARYFSHLELPAPAKGGDVFSREAQAWAASERGDVDTAIALLNVWDEPANAKLGTWLVDRLGARVAEKRAADDMTVFVALARSLATTGDDGMVRAIDVASRVDGTAVSYLGGVLDRFPPSVKIANSLAEAGAREIKRRRRLNDRGLAHLGFEWIPKMVDDASGAFDVLDTVASAWSKLAEAVPKCAGWQTNAVEATAEAVLSCYRRAPDPDVVVATLMSRHRTELAQRVALRVAARHVLPNGDRAMTRLRALRPELAASPDGIAALLRQAEVDRVTDALTRRVAPLETLPFEALRDLVARVSGLELLASSLSVSTLSEWTPGPWELAWRRRNRDEELIRRLYERAARAPRSATRSMELLALLGALDHVGKLDHAPASSPLSSRSPPSRASRTGGHDAPLSCRRTAASLAAQVRAERAGRIDDGLLVSPVPHVDAAYAELARRTLAGADAPAEARAAACEIVLASPDGALDFVEVLEDAVRAEDADTARRILDARTKSRAALPVHVAVGLWLLPDARASLASAIARLWRESFCARVWAIEREAAARGVSVEGLLEKTALALVATNNHDEASSVETLDQLRSVAAAVVDGADPADAATFYFELEDALSAATFLRIVRRLPVDRAAPIREAGKKLVGTSEQRKVLAAWLESTRSSASCYSSRA
jgi:hypothetical protein